VVVYNLDMDTTSSHKEAATMSNIHLPEFDRLMGDLFGAPSTFGSRLTYTGKVHACRPAADLHGDKTGAPICGARRRDCPSDGAPLFTDDAVDCAACLREAK
tara:strand:- start:230 stop:535 length:306 start_codon:yes stop_codon:yes gene_type:complete